MPRRGVRLRRVVAAAVLLGVALGARAGEAPPSVPAYGAAFWKLWGDGKAEIDSYLLAQPRYGELRKGTAVAIFVTETFSLRAQVKADPGKHPPEDEVPVLKLNLVKELQTGIYDYELMTSAFVVLADAPRRPAGSATKVTFSAQEWCGHVFHEVLFGEAGVEEALHSYFDGEGDRRGTLPPVLGGVSEDVLLMWARGLAGPVVARGASVDVPLLPSLESARLGHRRLAWTKATLSRGASTSTVKVPAGTFSVEMATARIGDRTVTYLVEAAEPRRIVRWEASDGEVAELAGSERLAYWKLNAEGDERSLGKLLLRPPSARP